MPKYVWGDTLKATRLALSNGVVPENATNLAQFLKYNKDGRLRILRFGYSSVETWAPEFWRKDK